MFSLFQIKSPFVIMSICIAGFIPACYTQRFESLEHAEHTGGESAGTSSVSSSMTTGGVAGSSQMINTGGASMSSTNTINKTTGGLSSIASSTGGSTTSPAGTGGSSTTSVNTTCPSVDLDLIKTEADYIRSCQYLPSDNSDPGYGAIARSSGNATIHVPAEIAMAAIALSVASKALNDSSYRDAAVHALDYLTRTPDSIYGGWHDQYNQTVVTDKAVSVNQTALVMILMQYIGFQSNRATVMNNAAGFVLAHQSVNNKGGADDGLLCKGRDAKGTFIGERWTSDNALGYLALKFAAQWAQSSSDTSAATEYTTASNRILTALNSTMLDASGTHWKRMINKDGTVPSDTAMTADWNSYSPALFNLPMGNVSLTSLGSWIQQNLQTANGAVVWDNSNYKARQSPMFSFEASLIWRRSGQCSYVNNAMSWARASGLWDATSGGWIDWSELSGNKAQTTDRRIETSAYAILNAVGNFSFSP